MSRAQKVAARRRVLLRLEREFWKRGLTRVAGVDEVGVGPLAGPLVAAAVILPVEVRILGIDDSKRLSARTRERLVEEIRAAACGIGVCILPVDEVDRLNVYHGSLEAMRRAVLDLPEPPEQLLVDARHIPRLGVSQMAITKGDAKSYSIAAASIVAKTTRDAIMREYDREFPRYGFARHMGYGTPEHLRALVEYGPCPIHRRSFEIVRQPRLPGLS